MLDAKPRGLWQQLDGRTPEPTSNKPRGMWDWFNARANDAQEQPTAPSGGPSRKSALGMYLSIHEADLRRAIRTTLVDVAWPDPAPDVAWMTGGDRMFGAMVATLVGDRLSDGEAAIVQLLYPSDVAEYFRRTIKLDAANWSPEFGLGFAGLVAKAALTSLNDRVGPSFRDALARTAAVPRANDLATPRPMDTCVASALTRPGIADVSNVAVTMDTAPTAAHGHGKRPTRDKTADANEPVPTREQLQDVDQRIGALLEQIRTLLRPTGLDSHLGHAYEQRAKRMNEIARGDEATRKRLAPQLQFQHTQLMTIAPQLGKVVTKFLPIELALKVSRDDARKTARDALWSIITRLIQAASTSDQHDESTAVLASISADAKIEDDAHRLADVDQATQGVIAAEGHSAPGAAAAQERAAQQRQATLTGSGSASKYEREMADTMAGEVALDSRIRSVERALGQLQAAAADAGFMDPATLHRLVPNAAKTVPELLAEVHEHLATVNVTWKHATTDGTPAVQEDPNAPDDWTDWVGRGAGLKAARTAFAKIAGDQGIGDFLRECADKIHHQQMLHTITTLAEALLITLVTGAGAAALGRTAAAAIAAEETTAATTLAAEGASAARAGIAVRGIAAGADIAINVSINSAVQFVQAGGQESLGWSMLENSLMEMFTRGLLGPIHAAQRTATEEARALSNLPHLSVVERAALRQTNFVGTEVAIDLVGGMATQWAAHRIVTSAHARAEVSEDFATTALEQGAAIGIGKFFHGKLAAWHEHRAELEKTPLGALPEAQALFGARERFYARARALAESVSPDPTEGAALQAENTQLLQKEKELVSQHAAAPESQAKQATEREAIGVKTSSSAEAPRDLAPPTKSADSGATEHAAVDKWHQAVDELARGSVPPDGLLPNTKDNHDGLARLADIQHDETIPPAVRQAFMEDFAARLRAMDKPTEQLFQVMKGIVYSHEGGAKYQRKGTKISNLAYVRDDLGGLRRLVALRPLCLPGMLSPEFYGRAVAANDELGQPKLPLYEELNWNTAQRVVELIKSGAIQFDPNHDLLPTGMIKGMNREDSAWFFAGADADVSDVRSAQSQLAIGGMYLDGYVVIDIPFEMALANTQTGHPGASRPTALDLTLDPLGKLNPNKSEPVGRTNPQSPEQVSAREVVLPPLPLSVTTRRTYVRAGAKK